MAEVFKLLLDNIGWIFLFFAFFGGGLGEFLVRLRKARAQGKIQGLRQELAAAQRELDTTKGLLATVSSGRPTPELQFVEFAATSARMARLLGLVQGADTAWPQLADGLRDQIDAELRAYETAVVPKALEAPKSKKARKA
jgi:hypothetical protein